MDNRVLIQGPSPGQWRQFTDPLEIVETDRLDEVVAKLRRVESLVRDHGLHAAGFIGYEAAPAFDSALRVRPDRGFPLLWFGIYRQPEIVCPEPPAAVCPPSGDWSPTISREAYEAAVAELRQCIARGETYQVNFTFRLRKSLSGDPWVFFHSLAEAQPSPYAAYIETPRFAICSASPELFFQLDGDTLTARPMKGTAARGRSYTEDMARSTWLAGSEKNRAENAMIVDMMRNDLGRVAQFGSIQVSDLFRVERYPTLWQMTSTVTARTGAALCDILAALFPCASITGAPKPNTMNIIARVETTPRRVYTGCIGTIEPVRQARFSVAIRTVLIEKGTGEAEYGVGGGIVWDSTPAGEYEECLLKARILTRRHPDFDLLETMLWTPEDSYFLLDYHLRRLGESAAYFGFSLDRQQVQARLAELAAALPPRPNRIRLLVSRDGRITCQHSPIEEEGTCPAVRLAIAGQPVDSADPFLYHKTTHREVYDAARTDRPAADDVLLYNERGEVTETCLANIVVRIGGELLTPPVECGLLPGTFRAWLLEQGTIREKRLDLAAMQQCDEIYVVNSVRKWRRAEVAPR